MTLNKRVCVLSLAGINDSRAQRTIRSMSKTALIDYFFMDVPETKINENIFDRNVTLYPLTRKLTNSIFSKFINHSFFFLDSSFLINIVLKTGHKYDVIYAHDLITSYAADKLAKINKSKIIYDVHDLYLETLNQLFPRNNSNFKNTALRTCMNFMKFSGYNWENYFFKKVDLTLTVNDYLKNYLINKYKINNCIVTPNFPEYKSVNKTDDLRKNLQLDDNTKIILYHGTLNDGRYLELIVESAKYLAHDKVLVVIGEGPLKSKLIMIAKEGGFENKVKFLNFINYEKLLENISSASLGLMLLEHINVSKKHASPNKITEYMAAGVPILVSDSPESRKMIEQADCGFARNFNSPKELAEFINNIFEDTDLTRLGKNGQAAFKNIFNWDKFEPVFAEEFRILLK